MKVCLLGAPALLLLGLLAGCLYDPDDRCGPQQKLSAQETCECVAGLVRSGTECVPCPEHELEQNGVCVCVEGYQRSTAGTPCEPIPTTGLGADCSDTLPCADAEYPYCEPTRGYCTSTGCESSADCSDGYACAGDQSPSFCKRPPLGQGNACASEADCSGTEATFCDTFITHLCLVEGCSVSPDDCFEGWKCCDVTSLGLAKQLCAPEGQCPTD